MPSPKSIRRDASTIPAYFSVAKATVAFKKKTDLKVLKGGAEVLENPDIFAQKAEEIRIGFKKLDEKERSTVMNNCLLSRKGIQEYMYNRLSVLRKNYGLSTLDLIDASHDICGSCQQQVKDDLTCLLWGNGKCVVFERTLVYQRPELFEL